MTQCSDESLSADQSWNIGLTVLLHHIMMEFRVQSTVTQKRGTSMVGVFVMFEKHSTYGALTDTPPTVA